MSYVWCRQSGQCGVGCVSWDILCNYDLSNGDMYVRSCASVLRVPCFRVFVLFVDVWCCLVYYFVGS